ncbi:cilia- and flagella-associated protein 36-like [Ornithodoros turicata]|uniref:cilia- and flagella-associated protein 36-like n=1 Tax=Ornithodoros turicata TaxID=34597 RepID=UPI00313953D5
MSSADDETTWVFESLVGYLKGPAWNIPILTFIEQKSVVFEPDVESEEYRKIHNEFKNLVDFMLGSHMEDMGITPEQFEKVCGKANRNVVAKFHQGLFEQVWAADDYEIFKRMMTQKNIELQLQALEILAQRHGMLSEILQAPHVNPDEITEDKSDTEENSAQGDEETLMAVVIKKSIEEMAAEEEKDSMEKKMMEEAIQATLAEKERLEEENNKEKELLDKALKLSLAEKDMTDTSNEEEAVTEQSNEEASATDAASENDDDTRRRRDVSSADMNKRREYLRSQRDKLVAMKKAEREKQLDGYDPPERPRSSRAARAALRGDVVSPPNTETDDSALAFRKSLAARLKAEVVDS